MLHLVGTGLYYLNDIPLRALETLRKSDEVFLEQYTNLNDTSFLTRLEGLIEKTIVIVGRESVESNELLERAKNHDVSLLVPGDPLFATTHVALLAEAKRQGIRTDVIHASSIVSSLGETGLSPYKFGAVSSIPIEYENFKPESFFDVIEKNQKEGLHSLILLEYKSKNEYVTANEAIDRIKRVGKKRGLRINTDSIIVISRLGSKEQAISFTKDLKKELPPPLALVVPGKMSDIEKEMSEILIE